MKEEKVREKNKSREMKGQRNDSEKRLNKYHLDLARDSDIPS